LPSSQDRREPRISSIALASAATVAASSATVASPAATTTTIATATASAPRTASAATVASSTSASVFPGLGFVHGESPTIVLLVMETIDGGQGLGLGVHLHEAESLAPAGVAVLDHLGALDGPELPEELLELRAVDLIGQIPHIQLLAHR
jgi:hypothetical protein